ncbi:unnamed protein product [Cylindrotheca closterium]|uniref:Uncharacterized protein n=1 Tax=Cylindrotheca closterium TaxID=2856 RepID=A0AAD2CED7_9STRA|nr:unnamed protein product [Cylindrotheca closterium]
MQSTLAPHVDKFLYNPETSSSDGTSSGDETPFDCAMTKEQPRTSSSSTPIKAKTQEDSNDIKKMVDSEYSYEDGPSFDCDGPPPNMENGIKVDFGLASTAFGVTPIKSNKTDHADRDDATVMTEPVTPSPFKTQSSSKKSISSSTRRRRQSRNEDSPFDEMPFDESHEAYIDSPYRLDTIVAAANRKTVSVLDRMEMEPDFPESRLPPRPERRRRKDDLHGSNHSASTCEDDADADIDYEADVERPQGNKDFGEYPYSDDDDTIGTAASENVNSVPTVRRRNNRKANMVLPTKKNKPSKPAIEEWCLNNVFDNIATDAALDVADWFADGYVEGKNNVKTLVYDCLVPVKDGRGYVEDGEEMVQLQRSTDLKSDLRVKLNEAKKSAKTMVDDYDLRLKLNEVKESAKTMVDDCLVPGKENAHGGRGYAGSHGGEEMVQLLRTTDEKSDRAKMGVPLTEEPKKPKRVPRKLAQRGRKSRRSMDDIQNEHDESSTNHSALRAKKAGSFRNMAPRKEIKARRSREHLDDDESNYSSMRSKGETHHPAKKAPTEKSNLATPTILTRTRSLLEDTPTKVPLPFIQRSATVDDEAMFAGNLEMSHSFDSTSTTKTDNFSVHHENNEAEDDDNEHVSSSMKDITVAKQSPPDKQGEVPAVDDDDDDGSALDQAAEMAAIVRTKPLVPVLSQEKPPSEDLVSESTNATKQNDHPLRQFKMPLGTQKMTMAQAKEVLKAAKSSGGIQSYPMFLEMEPESKYADTPPKSIKEWPPSNNNHKTQASNPPSDSSEPSSRTKKSRPVDRFGYAAALKDKSNNQETDKAGETWW